MPASFSFWSAYSDLQTERPAALYVDGKPKPQRIPWSAIARYAKYHGMNVDELKAVIWAMDDELAAGAVTYEPPDETEETEND